MVESSKRLKKKPESAASASINLYTSAQKISGRAGIRASCQHCGREFLAPAHNVRKGWGKYCSNACSSKAKIRGAETNCVICGTVFHASRSALEHGAGTTCSPSCRGRQAMKMRWGDESERFMRTLNASKADGCWLWAGSIASGRYGSFFIGGRRVAAHRYVYEHFNGPIPDGLDVLHRCDTPRCVNPDHLWLGSHKENMEDRNEKHRQARGTRHPRAKLTELQVAEIKTRLQAGEGVRHTARAFGISYTTARSIRDGRCWGWVLAAS